MFQNGWSAQGQIHVPGTLKWDMQASPSGWAGGALWDKFSGGMAYVPGHVPGVWGHLGHPKQKNK